MSPVGFRQRQNETHNIELMAAQRRMYSDAKRALTCQRANPRLERPA